MKKIVCVLVSLVVAILVIGGNAFAQDNIPEPSLGPEWKFVNMYFNRTTFYVNTKKITYLPGGIVKVWLLKVPRGETRRKIVNALKKYFLFKGEDPNNAERLWFEIRLAKFNCKTHQYAILDYTAYSFGQVVLFSHSFQNEKWNYIVPGSVDEATEKYVCKKYRR